MTELSVLCEHREPRGHYYLDSASVLAATHEETTLPWCPGGRPATVEEVVEWLKSKGAWPDTSGTIAATILAMQDEDWNSSEDDIYNEAQDG